jgi:Uma2 family endonuclease
VSKAADDGNLEKLATVFLLTVRRTGRRYHSLMGMTLDRTRRYSAAEYFEFEEQAATRHDFVDGYIIPLGEMIAMAGGSFEHSRIKSNVVVALGSRLRGHRCQVLNSDMRVEVPGGAYVYPDATILYGPPQFADAKRLNLRNPQIVVEVLSPGTAEYDRTTKFAQYHGVSSILEVVFVESSSPHVATHLRREDGTWSLAFHRGVDAICRFRSIDLQIPLAEFYSGIDFRAGQGVSLKP